MLEEKTPAVRVGEEGYYLCPECEEVITLDLFDYQALSTNKSMVYICPVCKTKLKLILWE